MLLLMEQSLSLMDSVMLISSSTMFSQFLIIETILVFSSILTACPLRMADFILWISFDIVLAFSFILLWFWLIYSFIDYSKETFFCSKILSKFYLSFDWSFDEEMLFNSPTIKDNFARGLSGLLEKFWLDKLVLLKLSDRTDFGDCNI